MEADRIREIAERDQLWASLRALVPEIQQLASGAFDNSERQRQLVQLMARIVVSEMHFRAGQAGEPPD